MSINFFIVRHATKEKLVGDVSITPKGISQAQLTAQYLCTIPITAIISSPLQRALETAKYIATNTKLTITIDSRLRERANWGDLPGQTFQEFVEMWGRCTREPDYIPPVGDSARRACERLSALLVELVKEYPDGSNIVIVTHGGLITDYLVNTFSENILNTFHSNFVTEQSKLVSECSISKLIYESETYMIDDFASVEHLGIKQKKRCKNE